MYKLQIYMSIFLFKIINNENVYTVDNYLQNTPLLMRDKYVISSYICTFTK